MVQNGKILPIINWELVNLDFFAIRNIVKGKINTVSNYRVPCNNKTI